jgi:hypothetical protein
MTDIQNVAPYQTAEADEARKWRRLAREGRLDVIRVVAAWSDICGFGIALEKANWDLESLKEHGIFEVLSQTYQTLGRPFVAGVPPEPSERVLIINDGVARSLDISVLPPDPARVIFYVRDLFMYHFMLEEVLFDRGLGLRTVLAGGERCQYSPSRLSGESLLFYSGEPSDYGKQLLAQQFVYNPSELQMNTGFALAYTLDGLGSCASIEPNRVYFEEGWIDALDERVPALIERQETSFEFALLGKPALSLVWDKRLSLDARGKQVLVYRASEMIVRHALEGEETSFPMARHDQWKSKA